MPTTLNTTLLELRLPHTARDYLLITCVLVYLLVLVETLEIFHRSVPSMLYSGAALIMLKWSALFSTIMTLAVLPFVHLQAVIIGSLLVMGLLTLYREWRRRWRARDRSRSSYLGGIIVVMQFLSMILLTATIVAALIVAIIVPARLLESRMLLDDLVRSWIEIVATLLFLLTVYYVLFYTVRRVLNMSGFSWIDPPNWRTLLPHLKYTRKLRWGLPPWTESQLADTVRSAYIEQIVGTLDLDAVRAAACIEPVTVPERGFSFAIIGDPGEGDHSQIAPSIDQFEVQEALEAADAPPANPGFIVISSDIVYPAGELMDYERTLYRPYRQTDGTHSPLMYALPGNHDWYNNLKGMFLNFGYAAAHATDADPQVQDWAEGMRNGPWARYGFPWGDLRWREVESLRQRYGLGQLGGDPQRASTHQRLPFFELSFGAVPFTLLAVDTGAVGSIDAAQQSWLIDRLQAANQVGKIIAVLLSEPLYVNGEFADGAHLRSIYELLRRAGVHVVMGGDTHAYQHYEVRYVGSNGVHTAHHFVNGGGGAYLAPPVDLNWHSPTGMTPLDARFVYRDTEHNIVDQVTLKQIYPTANDLRLKFTGASNGNRLQRWLVGKEPLLLERGYTNALDHDRSPLLQSFVTFSMGHTRNGWRLRVTPWFTSGPADALQAQTPIDIWAPAAAARSVARQRSLATLV